MTLRRLLNGLPVGTAAVAGGLAVLGVASYVHLAVAGHVLDHEQMSSVAVLWAIVFSVGLGVFFPLEQELTRIFAARQIGPGHGGPVLRRGIQLAAIVLGSLLVLVAATARLLADHLFGGDMGLVWALAGAFTALAFAHTTRGLLAGQGRFVWYGTQLGVDGALRMVLAAVLGIAGVESAFWFSFILALAPVASVALTLKPVLAEVRTTGLPISWREASRGLVLLTVSSLSAQLLVNVAVINVRLLDPGDPAVAAAMLSAMVLVRIPLFVFASLQASLLPSLTASVATGDRAGYHRLMRRSLAVVTVLGGVGGLVAVALGPPLAVLLFDAPDVLGAADYAWLAVGTLGYLWALVLGQGALALHRHRDQTVAWVVGVLVLAGIALAPGPVELRVEIGYALGSLVVAGQLAILLARRTTSGWSVPVPQATAVVGDHR